MRAFADQSYHDYDPACDMDISQIKLTSLPEKDFIAVQVKVADRVIGNIPYLGITIGELLSVSEPLYVYAAVEVMWEKGLLRIEVLDTDPWDVDKYQVSAAKALYGWRRNPYHTGRRTSDGLPFGKTGPRRKRPPTAKTKNTHQRQPMSLPEARAEFLRTLGEGTYSLGNLRHKAKHLFTPGFKEQSLKGAVKRAKDFIPEDERHYIEAHNNGTLTIYRKAD